MAKPPSRGATARLNKQQRLGGHRVIQFLGVLGVVTADAHHLAHREVDPGSVDILVLIAHYRLLLV
jgi:hypothetical protein